MRLIFGRFAEGVREKNSMTSVLKQISCLKDNSYHLNRAMWNDVHEDWPFYTESERQMLKRLVAHFFIEQKGGNLQPKVLALE